MLIFLLGPSIAIFCHHDTRYFFAFSPALQAKVFRNPSERAGRLKPANKRSFRRHCFDASHFPLQAIPAEALLHFPDPLLPLILPIANAPPIEALTRPSRPTLPVISAPAAEILPSETVTG